LRGLLIALALILTYAAARFGGVLEIDRWILALAAGLTALAYYGSTRRYRLAPPLPPALRWALGAGLACLALQCLPLPLGLLRALSPARADLAAAARETWAPLSVAPAQTVLVAATAGACLLMFALAREAAWRLETKAWLAAAPVVVIASLEAALGLAQYFSNWPNGVARGTYVNRNHFAGFLELGLLMAAGIFLVSDPPRREPRRLRQAAGGRLRKAAAMVAGALIVAGIIHSLSRMGFVAALFGLAVFALAAASAGLRHTGAAGVVGRGGRRLIVAGLVAGLVTVLFIYLPPDQLIARFAELAATDEINAGMRLEIWKESLALISSYPLLGCGAGGYEAAFLMHKSVAPMNTVDYAHNDYLQGLAEMGAAGFGLWLAAALGIAGRARRNPAVLGALAAIALHSLVDFNLYIPANSMAVAWVAGLGTADG